MQSELDNRAVSYGCNGMPSDYNLTDSVKRSWHRRTLRWHLLNADDMTYDQIKPIVQRCMDRWQLALNEIPPRGKVIEVQAVADVRKADILIVFTPTNHKNFVARTPNGNAVRVINCVWDFDGEGGILGHAFSLWSNYNAGEMHLDKSEMFGIRQDQESRNIEEIIMHEMGHIMHIGHSNNPLALMYAQYRGDRVELAHDDLLALSEVWSDSKRQLAEQYNIEVEEYNLEAEAQGVVMSIDWQLFVGIVSAIAIATIFIYILLKM